MKPYPQTKQPLNEQRDEIMASFDFKRVEQAMRQMNWTWATTGGVPGIDNLKRNAAYHLSKVIIGNLCESSSGGFVARKNRWGCLSLSFVVTDWCIDRESEATTYRRNP